MAYEALQTIVGTALVDSKFRHNLLDRVPGVLNDFPLTSEESAIIKSIRAKTFQGFVSELHGWISQQETRGFYGAG